MIPLTFIALDPELVAAVRRTRRDARGEAVELWISDGPGNPCRACLRPYAERGPVFIHVDACDAYATVDAFPTDFNERPLTLRGYSHAGRIVDAAVAPPGGALDTLAALFAEPRVAFVHARSPSWGCYDFEVRPRASTSPA